jgi:hypothetical protein
VHDDDGLLDTDPLVRVEFLEDVRALYALRSSSKETAMTL